MLKTIKRAALLGVSAVAIVAAPLAISGSGLSFSMSAALAAPGGNGHGGGGGGDGDNGSSGDHGNSGGGHSSNGNSGHSSSSSHGGSSDHRGSSDHSGSGAENHKAPSNNHASSHSNKPAESQSAPIPKVRNFNAQLAGLNSLKRNINGIMNSSDPRMEGIRDILTAKADIEGAQSALDGLLGTQTTAQEAYQQLLDGYTFTPYDGNADAYADVSLASLQQRLDDLSGLEAPADPDEAQALADEINALTQAIDAIGNSTELSDLTQANADVADAQMTLDGLESATSDEALQAALLAAANDNRITEDYVSPEMLAWARETLGLDAPSPDSEATAL